MTVRIRKAISVRMFLADAGYLIKKAREEKGWTLRQLASKLDMDASYIGDIENGKQKFSSINTLIRLSNEIGLSPLDVFSMLIAGPDSQEQQTPKKESTDPAEEELINEITSAVRAYLNKKASEDIAPQPSRAEQIMAEKTAMLNANYEAQKAAGLLPPERPFGPRFSEQEAGPVEEEKEPVHENNRSE
jgi:transcriptional regulator with XRE-family HTH domain